MIPYNTEELIEQLNDLGRSLDGKERSVDIRVIIAAKRLEKYLNKYGEI